MISIVIDLQYFPVVDYVLTLSRASDIYFDIYERHQKLSFRSRCIIAGANGPINLSVPLVGGRDQKQLTKELKVDNSTNWRRQHLKSIVSAYNRSPYFEYYRDSLNGLFLGKEVFLIDWNLHCLQWLMTQLKQNLKYSFTDSYQPIYEKTVFTDMRNEFHPRMNSAYEYKGPTYRQVFEDKNGHLELVSTLDLLFCAGPNAIPSPADPVMV